MSAVEILLPGSLFALLVILTHTYFGLHVLRRGIIFVDLALAQVAALGISAGFALGDDPHGWEALLYAFVATMLAACLLPLLRRLPGKTSREAVIGMVYVVATALSVLLLAQSGQGMEELKTLLNGSILFVRWPELFAAAVLYALVGVLLAILHPRFVALSDDAQIGRRGMWALETLFFFAFAATITLSVFVAGILSVFAFLIIPAFTASFLVRGFGARLLLGWALAIAGALAGLAFAYAFDLPVGAALVGVLGALPLAGLGIRFVGRR